MISGPDLRTRAIGSVKNTDSVGACAGRAGTGRWRGHRDIIFHMSLGCKSQSRLVQRQAGAGPGLAATCTYRSAVRCLVLVVGGVLAPVGVNAVVVGLLDSQVGHEATGGGAVPVPLPGQGHDRVPGPHFPDWFAALLHPAATFEDVQDLAARVLVPRGASAGGEVHAERPDPRRWVLDRDWVDPDGAGEA